MKWATLLIGLFVAANGHEDSEDPDHTHGKNANISQKLVSLTTVLVFKKFSVTHILREINFGKVKA